MRRKNFIISLMLITTTVVIVFVGAIIKKDTLETQKERLDFYTDYLDIQLNFVLYTNQQTANIAYTVFKNDETVKATLNNIKISDKGDFNRTEESINAYLFEMNKSLKTKGISNLNFSFINQSEISTKDRIQNKKPKYDCKDLSVLFSKSRTSDPVQGFLICDNYKGYEFVFPFYTNNDSLLGFFEVSFDFKLIKHLISNIVKNSNIGLIYIPENQDQATFNAVESGFNVCAECKNLFIDNEFYIPDIMRNNKAAHDLIMEKILNRTDKKQYKNFSVFLATKRNVSVLTLREIELLNKKDRLFLVAINHDTVLDKAQDLNNVIFIINSIIIILGMCGITYLVLNRFNILQQKQRIQKSEQKLLELNQSKDKFFSIVAHDLKNPFNGIMGMSGYLSTEYDNVSDNERREIISDINISSKNAFNLLQNLLEWTRAQSGTIRNVPIIIEPIKTIELALETVTNLAKIKQIEIIKTMSTHSCGWADENLVATVIRNLTTNAIKFSPRNSSIEILVKEFENELIFCVSDNGIGLREDEIDKLFRIDINFHKLGTEKEKGSGLGLKLCKEFVEYCGGRIWVISEFGQGSSFYFTLPLYSGQTTAFQH